MLFMDSSRRSVSPKHKVLPLRRGIQAICFAAAAVAVAAFGYPAYAQDAQTGIGLSIAQDGIEAETLHIGDSVPRRFEVAAANCSCYVRVSFSLEASGNPIDDAYSAPNESGWLKCGDGKWYLTSPLSAGCSAGCSVDMSLSGKGILPSAVNGGIGVPLSETVTAEAIDASAVEPDWTLSDPWNTDSGIEKSDSSIGLGEGGMPIASGNILPKAASGDGLGLAHVPQDDLGVLSGLPQTGDIPILGLVVMCALILAAFLLCVDIAFHRYKCRKESESFRCRLKRQ